MRVRRMSLLGFPIESRGRYDVITTDFKQLIINIFEKRTLYKEPRLQKITKKIHLNAHVNEIPKFDSSNRSNRPH